MTLVKRFFILTLSIVSFSGASAQTSSYGELQAAYLFNFAKYIKWPGETSEFVIGVYGEQEVMELFSNILTGKRAGGKNIRVKIIEEPGDASDCNIVYIASPASRKLKLLTEITEGKSILLVTAEDLITSGAMISFFVEDDKLKFKLKKQTLAETGLTASDGLLKLAIVL